jgi:1-phosphatidylinositol-4-phosphate 5-kinase
VLKTLKESEKKLLLEGGILESYYTHVMANPDTLLSKYYGVFEIKISNMEDITCFVMDNLLGKDFHNIERIYDLKGSTLGRKVELNDEEIVKSSGLKVLKDLNFI